MGVVDEGVGLKEGASVVDYPHMSGVWWMRGCMGLKGLWCGCDEGGGVKGAAICGG